MIIPLRRQAKNGIIQQTHRSAESIDSVCIASNQPRRHYLNLPPKVLIKSNKIASALPFMYMQIRVLLFRFKKTSILFPTGNTPSFGSASLISLTYSAADTTSIAFFSWGSVVSSKSLKFFSCSCVKVTGKSALIPTPWKFSLLGGSK